MNKATQTLPGFDAETISQGSPVPQTSNIPRGIDGIEEAVAALTDPIIVFPNTGWEQDLPEGLKKRLPMDRLAHNMLCLNGKARWDEAPDIEALLYLFPASLAAPMGHYWTKIYLYLGTKVMGEIFPDDIKEKSLSDYEMGMLRDLKRWLRRKKLEARKTRHKQATATQKPPTEKPSAAIVPEKYEQNSMF